MGGVSAHPPTVLILKVSAHKQGAGVALIKSKLLQAALELWLSMGTMAMATMATMVTMVTMGIMAMEGGITKKDFCNRLANAGQDM